MRLAVPSATGSIARFASWGTALVPVLMSNDVFFSYTLPKLVAFRGLVSIALIAALACFIIRLLGQDPAFRVVFRRPSPFVVALFVFLVLSLFSALLADNTYRAFWGDIERGEGVIGMVYYSVFLLILLAAFREKEWVILFKIFLITGALNIVFAFVQYFGSGERPIALIGNPAFLASYFIFVVMAAGFVWSKESGIWRQTAAIIGLAAVGGIFLTNTRGALLGVAAGGAIFLFTFAASSGRFGYARRIAAAALVAGVILGGVFLVTRHNAFWQNVPGFDRLARTAFFDPNDPSTQTRIIAWRISWNAFIEKPVLGWGPDNYILAFERHYEPALAEYGDVWLDRSHNKVLDLLVMYGAVGAAAYFAMFAALLAAAWRFCAGYKGVIIGGLIAQLVSSMFLMEQLVFHLGFFAFAGLVLWERRKVLPEKTWTLPGFLSLPAGIAAGTLSVVLLFSLYAWNYIPYAQSKMLTAVASQTTVLDAAAMLRDATDTYNFAQQELLAAAFDTVFLEGFVRDSSARALPDHDQFDKVLLRAIRDVRGREPHGARNMLREAQILDAMAIDDPDRYRDIEELMREGIERTPQRQELYYQLALSLMKQEKFSEAIAVAGEAVRLAPAAPRSHLFLAIVSAAGEERDIARSALVAAESIDPDLSAFIGAEQNLILAVYADWGETAKIAEFVHRSIEGKIVHRFELRYVKMAMRHFILSRDKESLIAVAKYLREDPRLAEDMDLIINLANQGSWGVLESL